MATLSITVPDAQVQRVLDAFAAQFEYDPTSGVTQQQFVKQRISAYVREIVLRHERALAQQAITDSPIDVA